MRIGIDLGGTKIEAVALDAGGAVRFRRRATTPKGDYDATIGALVDLVAAAETAVGPSTVGVGIPGAVSKLTGAVKNANSTWLNGRPFGADLSRALGRDVRLENDANCFALSEAVDGAAAGALVVFGVIVGTGTGGGIVIGRQVLAGRNAIAGEWGHNPLPWPGDVERPGPRCYCGQAGCIETFLSGPGLARDYFERTGVRREAPEIVARAADGEPAAEASMDLYEDRMARALASVINVLDPDSIVLGGGLSNVARLYENVPRRWGKYVFSDAVATAFVPPLHGDASGVRGAAWLWSTEEAHTGTRGGLPPLRFR